MLTEAKIKGATILAQIRIRVLILGGYRIFQKKVYGIFQKKTYTDMFYYI